MGDEIRIIVTQTLLATHFLLIYIPRIKTTVLIRKTVLAPFERSTIDMNRLIQSSPKLVLRLNVFSWATHINTPVIIYEDSYPNPSLTPAVSLSLINSSWLICKNEPTTRLTILMAQQCPTEVQPWWIYSGHRKRKRQNCSIRYVMKYSSVKFLFLSFCLSSKRDAKEGEEKLKWK